MSFHADPLDSTSINLTSEDLVDVPLDEIVKYPQVLYVDLSINNIRSLNKDFAPKLSNIVHLDLSKNCLEKLPSNFGLLSNLQHLDLYSNKIQSLPVSMANMKKLVWLDMKDNPINSCLKEVVGEFWNAEECKAAANNIVFFMSQVKMFIKNVKDFEYQNVHSFTLKTNPFSTIFNPSVCSDLTESLENPELKYDNNNAAIDMNGSESNANKWNSLKSLKRNLILSTVWLFVMMVCAILFSVVLYGPGTVESMLATFGCNNPVDHFIGKIHKNIQYYVSKVIPAFPLVKDSVPQRSWYQKLGF